MIAQMKYKLIKTHERVTLLRYSDSIGLKSVTTVINCCIIQDEVFDNPSDAVEFRDMKDFPNDYLVITVW